MTTQGAGRSADAARLWPLYVGGFLGPFGGQLPIPMLPEIAGGLGTTLGVAAWSLSAYTFPLAALMLVSGTLADLWGRSRSVRFAYVGYAVASLVCALALTAPWFLGGRALQGVANAFTTPLLVAAIYDAVPRARLGRSLGLFGSLQAAGMAFAPLAGGLAAAVDYRLAFGLLAALAAALAFVPPRDPQPHPDAVDDGLTARQRWRALANPRLARAAAVAFCFNLAAAGVTLLVALTAADRFGLGPTPRGLLIAAFGTAGLLTSPLLGRLIDRFGVRRTGLGAFVLLAGAVGWCAVSPSAWGLVLGVAVAGSAATGSRVVVNSLSVTSTPPNPAGAASVTMSLLFAGSAIAPLAFLPLYQANPAWAFAGAGLGALLASALILPRLSTPPAPASRPAPRPGV